MPKVSGVIGNEPGKLLKGSDVVSAKKTAVGGVILEVRDSPKGFGSPLIIDFDSDVLPGISSWPVNITESRKLASMIADDTELWAGWAVVLVIEKKNNPKTNRDVDSLVVDSVLEPKVAAKKRTSKPKYTISGQPGKAKAAFTPDDIPF